MTDEPTQRPLLRASDADREQVVGRLEKALAEGRLSVEEFQRRAESAYASVTNADLDPLLADLPAHGSPGVEIVGSRTPPTLFNVFGDLRVSGGSAPVPRRAGTVFGNVRIDLRGLRTDAEQIELDLSTVFGDIDVIIPEGVDGELHGWTVLGDRKTDLAPVPRLAGTPRVVVRAHAVFGDLRLRSLAPGESVSRWRALLDRLAERPQQPLPPAP
jgi:Domain of unknown function (DUF1707)